MPESHKLKATDKRIVLKGETKVRVVYMGPRGGCYVKKAGSFVPIPSKQTQPSKQTKPSEKQKGGVHPSAIKRSPPNPVILDQDIHPDYFHLIRKGSKTPVTKYTPLKKGVANFFVRVEGERFATPIHKFSGAVLKSSKRPIGIPFNGQNQRSLLDFNSDAMLRALNYRSGSYQSNTQNKAEP